MCEMYNFWYVRMTWANNNPLNEPIRTFSSRSFVLPTLYLLVFILPPICTNPFNRSHLLFPFASFYSICPGSVKFSGTSFFNICRRNINWFIMIVRITNLTIPISLNPPRCSRVFSYNFLQNHISPNSCIFFGIQNSCSVTISLFVTIFLYLYFA